MTSWWWGRAAPRPRADVRSLEARGVERLLSPGPPALLGGPAYLALKRAADVAVATLAIPFALPVIAACALALWIESPWAPILFRQERTGRYGRRFTMYKLRTMRPDAERMKLELAHMNELQWPDFKIKNDPRVTRVGRFLRATSLDELPQLVNILRGEMGFIGPRPTSFAASTYRLWQTERLDVRPGLTGLWQVCGRGELEFDDRVRLDIEYIDHCSFGLDVAIVARTIGVVLRGRGS